MHTISEYIGEATNNEAEYIALIKGLEYLIEINELSVNCYLDSKLVVEQAKGNYRVRAENLIELKRLMDTKKLDSHLEMTKYIQNNSCYVIQPKDRINIVGKVKNNEFLKVYINKIDRELYIRATHIKYKYTKDNNLLNKTF